MKAHPACALLPAMGDDEFADLVADVKANGLRQPITTLAGQILDGRHRFRACEQAGVEPRFVPWDGDGDPVAWVLSVNVHRRHLTASQKAAIAVEAESLFKAEAEKRRARPGKPRNVPADRQEQTGEALAQAAKAVGAGTRTAARAKAVKAEAPDLFEKVKAGEVTVEAATKQVAQAKTQMIVDTVDDDELRRLRYLHRASGWRCAVSKGLIAFEPATLASFAEPDDWDDMRSLKERIDEWFAALEAARPQPLRIVNGDDR